MSINILSGSSIEEVTKLLRQAMNAGSVYHSMGVRADTEKIKLFEEAFGVKLPESFKIFLSEFDGGFLADHLANLLWLHGEFDNCKQMCSHFLSIEEIIEEYDSMSLDKWKLRDGFEGYYPYIPFYTTNNNEKLIFVDNHNDTKESFIYAAFHDDFADGWFVVEESFTEFLIKYINTDGKPNLYESKSKIVAGENLSRLDNRKGETENPSSRIKQTTAYLSLYPDGAYDYLKRANAYRDDAQYEKALADYKKSLELNPKYSLTHYCRGNMLFGLKKARQALIDFDSACQLEPDDPLFLSGRADAFVALKKLDEALADCNRAIEVDDSYYIAYSIRHSVYLSLGDTDKANADARRLDELNAEME